MPPQIHHSAMWVSVFEQLAAALTGLGGAIGIVVGPTLGEGLTARLDPVGALRYE